MPKHVPSNVKELEHLAQELEASAAQPSAPVTPRKPSGYPKPIEVELLERVAIPPGFVMRINYCDVHGIEYYQSISSQVRDGDWKGLCPTCSSTEWIERRAKSILAERRAEVSRRVAQRMPAYANEIAAAVESRLAEHCAEVRPEIEQDVQWQIEQRESASVQADLLAEIMAELKGA